MTRNPVGVLRFISAIGSADGSGQGVSVDLRDVTELTSDAVVLLLSKINDPTFTKGNYFGGTEPEDSKAKELLRQSGFFQFVNSHELVEPPKDGRIRRKTSFIVEADVADDLVAFATERVKGAAESRPGVYRALVECMGNTHEHAGGSDATIAQESWWANVYCPTGSQRAFFTFVDNGVGIFRSVTMKKLRRGLAAAAGTSINPGLLRDILEGRIAVPSRTGKKNRGKGLKAIYRVLQKGQIKNLIIIANDVFADVAANKYEEMKIPYSGTFLYWELGE